MSRLLTLLALGASAATATAEVYFEEKFDGASTPSPRATSMSSCRYSLAPRRARRETPDLTGEAPIASPATAPRPPPRPAASPRPTPTLTPPGSSPNLPRADAWTERWVKSDWKQSEGTAGEFTLTAGQWYGDAEADKGIQTGPDARFYAVSADMGETFSNEGKSLVVQFSAKHEQKLDCGGGYVKILPSTADQATFGGDTPYQIMFGPDICGTKTKRVHVIFTDKKGENLLTKREVACETDQLTHVYTLVLHPNNTYAVLVDNEERASGDLEADWDFLPPETIADPEATKPEDWDDRAKIPDEEDVKPEGWDDIPETIADPDATKPEDWDDEDDGEWEAPTIPNPDFKGPWKQKMIDNPAYKGTWSAPMIPNPEYVADDQLYKFDDLRYVGFELWQVKAGSIFDNVLVTDDVEYAREFAEKTWGASKDAEKAMFDEVEEAKRKADEAEAKRLEDEAAAAADDADDDEDYEPEEAEVKDEL